jgi:3-hydroxyisobutyrate dehydrogenase-like beta-hydroxyacid dehydrogenase
MASREINEVAFFGLGTMGWPMAANLIRAGFELSVWTHSEGKAERFASEHGARAGATPREAAEAADAAVIKVVDSPEVKEVLLGDDGAAEALADGALCIDMSTIAPTAAKEIGELLRERGLLFLEAPVSGSRPKAEDGTLTIMAGGELEAFERARPLLDVLGEKIVYMGPQGHGQMAKLLANTMGAVNAAVLGEAVTVARRAGLDRDAFLEVAQGSAGSSAMLQLKGRPMFEHEFEPALFKLGHMLKDVRHTLAEARELEVELRFGELAERMYSEAAAAGHGEEDLAAIVTAAEAAAQPETLH